MFLLGLKKLKHSPSGDDRYVMLHQLSMRILLPVY